MQGQTSYSRVGVVRDDKSVQLARGGQAADSDLAGLASSSHDNRRHESVHEEGGANHKSVDEEGGTSSGGPAEDLIRGV